MGLTDKLRAVECATLQFAVDGLDGACEGDSMGVIQKEVGAEGVQVPGAD